MSTTQAELDLVSVAEEPGYQRPISLFRAVMRTAEGRIGLGLAVFMLLLISVGRLAAPFSPTAINVGPPIAGPSHEPLAMMVLLVLGC